jgi:hypothetical protein
MFKSTSVVCAMFAVMMLFNGCIKEDPILEATALTPTFTGYISRDENGNTINTVGNPNVKLEGANGESFVTFPNPTHGSSAHVSIMGLLPHQKADLKVFSAVDNSLGNTQVLGAVTYVPGGIEIFRQTGLTNGGYTFDFSMLHASYVVIVLETENERLYDNLIIF